jgi:hypothetical protein
VRTDCEALAEERRVFLAVTAFLSPIYRSRFVGSGVSPDILSRGRARIRLFLVVAAFALEAAFGFDSWE